MNRARHLLHSSIIVILFLALAKLTGLVRTRLLSAQFGTSSQFDAFTAANQLPEVFVTLIAGGALAAAFIPVYIASLATDRERPGAASSSAQMANTILTLLMATLATLSAAGALFAPWITSALLVPDFPLAQQALTASLMRIILVQTTLFGVSGVLSSILNAHQHFALPALAPIALDLGYLIGLFFLVPTLGIHGVAWGTVIGGFLHILIQLPALRRYRFRFRPVINLKLAGVREVIRLMGPRIVTLGAVQVADLFTISLASGLPTGSTSAYFYGYYLMQFPETLFGTAIAIVLFPTMAELFIAGEIGRLKQLAVSALGIIWTLTIPAAAAMILLGRPAIALLLQGGAFTAASTNLVYGVLVFFSVRVVSEATLEIVARLFYAQHHTRTPMLAALGWLVVTVSLSFLLVRPLGIGGLALASTVAFTFQSAALFWLNSRRLGGLGGHALAASAGRTLLATAAMSLIVGGLGKLIASPLRFLLVGGTAGLLSYLLVTLLLGGPEIPTLVQMLRRRGQPVQGGPEQK